MRRPYEPPSVTRVELQTVHAPEASPDHVHQWAVFAIGQVLACCGPTQRPARVCQICGEHQIFSELDAEH